MVYPTGGFLSSSVTEPVKFTDIGPIFSVTLAANSVSERFSSSLQPGMQRFKTSGSLSAPQTTSRGAAMRYWPVISMSEPLRLNFAIERTLANICLPMCSDREIRSETEYRLELRHRASNADSR